MAPLRLTDAVVRPHYVVRSSPVAALAVETHDLVKTYSVRGHVVHALKGVSLAVPSGIICGLLGPNGAGKTSLMKILTTLSWPTAGRATVAGVDVTRRPDEVRRLIGFVPQRPSFDPMLTGRENLMLQGRIFGLSGRLVRRRSDELLQRFQLHEAANRLVSEWSGGMQRKLDVALALMHEPQMLFLDEPTTGLDPAARAALWDEIRQLTRSGGMTVLLTTHYMDEADRLADELVIIDQGQVVTRGRPEDLKGALGGDIIAIELLAADEHGRARSALEAVAGVNEVWQDAGRVRARVSDGPRVLPSILAELSQRGLELVSVAAARPSLDEVYLHHTGKTFQGAETPAEEATMQ